MSNRVHFFLKKIFYVIKEMVWSLIFFFDSKKRKHIYSVYDQCSSAEEYFRFAAKTFYLTQVKEEVLKFLNYSASLKPKYILEIGTFYCGLTFLLCHALKSVSLTISIDQFTRNAFLLHYFSKPGKDVKLISGSSYDLKTVEKIKKILKGKKIDLLFIDGDHSHKGVREDFLSYRQLVRDGGIIAFHDILPDYFTLYGTETGTHTGGVPDFYNRVKKIYSSREFVEDPQGDGFGIGLIRYSSSVVLPNEF